MYQLLRTLLVILPIAASGLPAAVADDNGHHGTATNGQIVSPETIDGVINVGAEGLIEKVMEIPELVLIDSRITADRKEGYIEDSISLPDIDTSCGTLAATLGTTQEDQVKRFFPNAKHKIVEAPARDFQEVLSGRADAHITSNVEAYKLVEKYPQMMVVPVAKARARTPIAMLLPQDDQVWINFVNTWIQLKSERGFFDELGRKWKLSN